MLQGNVAAAVPAPSYQRVNQTALVEGERYLLYILAVNFQVVWVELGTTDLLEGISTLGMGRRKGALFFDGMTGFSSLTPACQNGAFSTSELDTKATLEASCLSQEVQP